MIRDISTEVLIMHLRQAASVWFKNDDLLKLEEIFRRLIELENMINDS